MQLKRPWNELQGDLFEELCLSEEMLLDYNDVAVLQFVKTGKAIVRVSQLAIDEEGFAVDSIDSAIHVQNVKAGRLYTQLLDNE